MRIKWLVIFEDMLSVVKYEGWLDQIKKELKVARDEADVPDIIFELINELSAHQIELEMQNEELSRSQREYSDLYNQYHELYDELPIGYFTLDDVGIIKNVNKKGTELLDLEKKGVMNRWIGLFIPKNVQNKFHRKLMEARDKQRLQEFEIQLKRGEYLFDAQIKIKPLYRKKGESYQVTIEDITHRKLIENNLEQQHALLEAVIESSKDHILSVDHNYHYTSFNSPHKKFMKLLYGSDIQMGHNILYYHTNLEDRRKAQENIDRILKGESFTIESYYGSDAFKRRYFLITHNPVKDTSGNVIGCAVYAHDFTSRKKVEENLKHTMKELQRSNRELEQFAYVVSHDLQEPLRMVSSFTQLLEKRYKGQLDEDADEYIDFIIDGAQRMRDLIDDLLAFSRLNTETEEFKETNLETVLNEVLTTFNSSIGENDVLITHNNLPTVMADPTQINQLFQNLLSNAIKFRGNRSPKIHLDAEELEDDWKISISDNGIGISPLNQKKIFNVFTRLHTRQEYEGTGIGLSICKKIVQRHGGRIWVESEKGKGSTFYFILPKNKT